MRIVFLVIGALLVVPAVYAYQYGSGFNQGDLEMIDYSIDGDSDAGLAFDPDNDNTNEVVMDANGNIGIGTTNPAQKLDVEGRVSWSGGILPSETGAEGQILKISSGEIVWSDETGGGGGNYSDGDAQAATGWQRSGTNVILFNSSDSVGIGTTSPSEALEVNGNILGNTGNFNALIVRGTGSRLTFNSTSEYVESVIDDMFDFVGVGGADNTDLRLDVDGVGPTISSTDDTIYINDNLNVTGNVYGAPWKAGVQISHLDADIDIVIANKVDTDIKITALNGKSWGGGTSVTNTLKECDANFTNCVNMNNSNVFTNNATTLELTSFTDNIINSGSSAMFSLVVSGTVPNFKLELRGNTTE